MSDVKAFKSLPTFDAICARLDEAERCIAAQGEIILAQQVELQEREYEITFLMNISSVVIPQSNIAGADGKIPAIRRSARDIYMQEGRAKVVALFEQRAKAIADAENLPQTDSPEAVPQANGQDPNAGPIEFRIPGKVTH